MFFAPHPKTVAHVGHHPGYKADQVFRHQAKNVRSHHRVGDAGKQNDLRNGAAHRQQRARNHRAGNHEQCVEDVVGRNDARAVRGLAALLDERVHGHAVQTGKQAEQGQIGDHTPVGGLGQKGADGHQLGRRQGAAGEIQVDGKHAHANCTQRHQPDFDFLAAEHLAQQRPGANAHRKNHQQQGRHLGVAMQNLARQAGKLAQKHGAKKPHPANAQERAKHRQVFMGQTQVAPGLGHRVPVHAQGGVRRGGCRNESRHQAAKQRQPHTGHRHAQGAHFRKGNQQSACHIAQQNRHKSAHFHHAVAACELAVIEHLRQVGKFDRTKQRGMQAHQKRAQQQQADVGGVKTQGRNEHDGDFQAFDKTHHVCLAVFVRQLPAGGRKQQKRQDKQGPNHQAGHGAGQPRHAELVGDHHSKRELEHVVIGCAQKLGPEKRRKAPLLEQRKLVGVGVRGGEGRGRGFNGLHGWASGESWGRVVDVRSLRKLLRSWCG